MNLSQYSVIVFGSNNAEYTKSQINAFNNYIKAGGSALFVSDANFGQNWGDAPSSDQQFLERFGMTMNQDGGTYGVESEHFLIPDHPILRGVKEFDGEGVSAITRDAPPLGVSSSIITKARHNVSRNTGADKGPSMSATGKDGSLVVATFGAGRVAGHYDRNTFFNDNGAGTNINRLDNEIFTRNLFNWLIGKSTPTKNYAPRGHFPALKSGAKRPNGNGFSTEVIAKDPDGEVVSVTLKVDGEVITKETSSPYQFRIPNLKAGQHIITAVVVDNQGAATEVPSRSRNFR